MIKISHLNKQYGDHQVIKDISFEVVTGEILGFLGPNGAGKSTTMKILTGFIAATSGEVSVWGCDIETETLDAQRHIGYLPEGTPAYEEMTPRGFLDFIAEVRGFDRDERLARIEKVAQTMSLHSVLDQRIETLSKGFRRRVGLAQAILHDPDVLVLDEPTDGLDPNQKHQVREMIRGLSKDKIVIISTHILEEVTAVCTRAIIISEGKIVSDCSPQELEAQSLYHGSVTLTVVSDSDVEQINVKLQALAEVQAIETNGLQMRIIPHEKNDELLSVVLKLVKSEDWSIAGLYQERGKLEDVFRDITGAADSEQLAASPDLEVA